ncbi:Oxidoreductase AflY [Pleurostoma richardsiae]|uniref:Oxidoreductase AflY n=1 Tax=Pleurostoma richardsiae TaxID=41990 RepID=A0AA38RH94_9PEZI|nr:Oxidoreductase AflY [Pleurostoma richardsiae]
MDQMDSRSTFSSLVTRNHVEHALIQQDEAHNIIPMALATAVHLGATPVQIQSMYDNEERPLRPWSMSPGRITDAEGRQEHLGDARFQRAYMDYFSMLNGHLRGNSRALALSQLLSEPKPLIYGLFSGYGQPMIVLSDGFQLQNPILILEGLVFAAVDFRQDLYDILCHPQVTTGSESLLRPDILLGRIAYDGRFSGLMRSGPGLNQVSLVLSNSPARAAIIDYVSQLDTRDIPALVSQLSYLAVQLLCATHKRNKPAFDYYLSFPLSAVQALRVMLSVSDDEHYGMILVRGTWLLIVLSYITQLRPCIDDSLILNFAVREEDCNWQGIVGNFSSDGNAIRGTHSNAEFLRALWSLSELGKVAGHDEQLYIRAARKLERQWERWTGFGNVREDSLNIRL